MKIPFRSAVSRMFLKAILVFIFAVIIMDSAVAQSQVRSDMIEVTAAVPKDFPPYYFVDESGSPKGFAIDVMGRIAEMAGLRVTYLVENSWTDAAEAVKSGRADLIPNIGITANRKVYFDYTAPVETFAISIFVRKETNYIKGVDDVAGHKVAAIKYNIAVILLQDHEDVDLEVFNDPREAVFELLSGHVDAVLYPAPVFMKIVREAKVDHRIKIVGKPLREIKRAMAVSKGNMNLLDRLNEAINRFVGTNDYQHIYLKWFGKPQPFWTISKVIWAMSGLFLILFTTMALWRYNSIIKLNRKLLLNIADRKRAEKRIVHLNAVLQAVRNVNQLITKVKDRERLLQGACDNFIKIRGYNTAWIVLIERDCRFITAAQAGAGDGFPVMVDGLKRGELTQCMHQAVDQSGVVVVANPAVKCSDCSLVGIYAGKARLIARLEHKDHIYGFITVTVSGEMAVDEEELSLFEEVAGDIAFALHNLELEKEHKRADKALLESESQYKHLYSMVRLMSDNLPDLIWTKDLENRFIFANKACCEKLLNAKDTDEPIGKTDMYFADREKESHPENPEYHTFGKKCTGSDLVVLETKKPQRFDESGHVKGKFLHLDIYKAPFWDEKGNMIGTVGCARVVTKERQMEEERKQAEEEIRKLSSAVEQSIDGVVISNLEAKLTYVNYAFAMAHGYSPEEMIGLKPVDLLKKEDLNKYTNGLNEVKTLGSLTCEIEHIRKDGTPYPTFMSLNLLKDAEGRPTGILAVVKDITEQKKLEEQFRQAQKMEAIGNLAGGVAHDFNNLLTIIIGNAQLALMNVIKDESLRKRIEDTMKAGERAASLTRQLLAFSRKQIITPRALDFNKLLTGIEKMLARLIGEDVELLTIPEPALWKVDVDPGQMEQVIMNLAINARDAMPMGGNLTIETANIDLAENYFHERGIKNEPGAYVMLAVSDTGKGMDKETREHIFEPFFTTKEVGKGTGLGLSTVYGIVKQNNGFVWVYSEPGQGSTFKVYLPKVKGEAEPEEKEQTSVAELAGSETVLIVDDDDGLRKFAQEVLLLHGYRVLDAENGEDALRVSQAHEGQIDLMITDVVMPKMGGKQAADRLQPLYPQMNVIYMSGYTDNAIVHHGVLAPGLNFLEKPFSPEGLARKVREVLDNINQEMNHGNDDIASINSRRQP